MGAPPYSVNLNALNSELARLVSIAQGSSFLATGSRIIGGSEVVALLWPLDAGIDISASVEPLAPPPPSLLEPLLDVVRAEAGSLVRKHFSHVQSCLCGQ